MAFGALIPEEPVQQATPPPSESDSSVGTGPAPPHRPAGKSASSTEQLRSLTNMQRTSQYSTRSGRQSKSHCWGSHLTAGVGNAPQPRGNNTQSRHLMARLPRAPNNPLELRIYVMKIPLSWTTWDLYSFFRRFGNLTRVDMYETRTQDRNSTVVFQPAPRDISWVDGTVVGRGPDGAVQYFRMNNNTDPIRMVKSINDSRKWYPERMTIPLLAVDVGIMQTEFKMQILQSSQEHANLPSELTLDIPEKAMFITFALEQPALGSMNGEVTQRDFKMRINLAQMRGADVNRLADNTTSLIFSIDSPPQVFRKTSNIKGTHRDGATLWDERTTWFRQTDIDADPLSRNSPVKLSKDSCIIDIGRWLSYRLRFAQAAFLSPAFADISQALVDHNIHLRLDKNIAFDFSFFNQPAALSNGLDCLAERTTAAGSLGDMHQMKDESLYLPFNVRYQLEVCLSLGVIQDCNIQRTFIEQLVAADPDRAVKVLEKVADAKERYYEPERIFRLQNQVSVIRKRRVGYCTEIPSAVVTPSTIYYATPVMETSNRVVRQFQQYENRFLRVKFTDERYKGKIMSSDDSSMNEVFSRVLRTLTYGIMIGNRHYEFLAFGSSQFREHGAYFFASTSGCTAEDIRRWMGDFTTIKAVAKYCSRLGQCFSTTRAIPHTVHIERIPDVTHDGFNFTDGVGKLSPFLARMIANHFHLPNNSELDCPSVFQFRLAGCKGVLAVDPALKGTTMQIRPSQEKFSAKYQGLEICRIAQFQAANLNVQLILVLSTLGVPDRVFIDKLRSMLSDLSLAMTNERKACELLQKNIDYNQMTLELASMIYDGFMESQDPYMITCLRLWRSWNLKYLKEKARIFVEGGAFLIGITDETRTLRGHFNHKEDNNNQLPEIFLQIPDAQNKGKFKVVTGVCSLTRNPCLHPGDIRVVRAVDVPALHHHRNTVILPQTGDRDIANMCSGGDLDGDDYIIIWDQELLPREWNHEPMDYTALPAVESRGPVTVQDIAKFFVNHIKHDNLSRIAVAHRYWADNPRVDDVVKDPRCLELAELHSKAVDYAKTGVPAEMPAHLRVRMWPHWSEPKSKSRKKIYHSKKILGMLYDEVRRESFEGGWDFPFDRRILEKHAPTEQELRDASEIKTLYDEAVRRIMAQHGIQTEFEVTTTFVLDHHREMGDYKFAETIGEVVRVLREEFRGMCYSKAGTNPTERDWSKMKPFLIAMYSVTADEVRSALLETKETTHRGGQKVSVRPMTFGDMPFISFPWLFARELGKIATDGKNGISMELAKPSRCVKNKTEQNMMALLGDEFTLPPLPEVTFAGDTLHEGDVLDLFQDEDPFGGDDALQPAGADSGNASSSSPSSFLTAPAVVDASENHAMSLPFPSSRSSTTPPATSAAAAAAGKMESYSNGSPSDAVSCSTIRPNVAHLVALYKAAGLPADSSILPDRSPSESSPAAAQTQLPNGIIAVTEPLGGYSGKDGDDDDEGAENSEEKPEEVCS